VTSVTHPIGIGAGLAPPVPLELDAAVELLVVPEEALLALDVPPVPPVVSEPAPPQAASNGSSA